MRLWSQPCLQSRGVTVRVTSSSMNILTQTRERTHTRTRAHTYTLTLTLIHANYTTALQPSEHQDRAPFHLGATAQTGLVTVTPFQGPALSMPGQNATLPQLSDSGRDKRAAHGIRTLRIGQIRQAGCWPGGSLRIQPTALDSLAYKHGLSPGTQDLIPRGVLDEEASPHISRGILGIKLNNIKSQEQGPAGGDTESWMIR